MLMLIQAIPVVKHTETCHQQTAPEFIENKSDCLHLSADIHLQTVGNQTGTLCQNILKPDTSDMLLLPNTKHAFLLEIVEYSSVQNVFGTTKYSESKATMLYDIMTWKD